jgi:hypothetical protein
MPTRHGPRAAGVLVPVGEALAVVELLAAVVELGAARCCCVLSARGRGPGRRRGVGLAELSAALLAS